MYHWMQSDFAVLPPCLCVATPKDGQLLGDHISFLPHSSLGWLSTLAASSNSCGISSYVTLSPANHLRAMHHLCVLLCLFQPSYFSEVPAWLFPLSLLSLFRAAPPAGQWLEFVMKTNLSQKKSAPPSKRVFNFRSLHMKMRNPESHFLGMLSWDFFVGGKGKQGQEIFMPKGKIR